MSMPNALRILIPFAVALCALYMARTPTSMKFKLPENPIALGDKLETVRPALARHGAFNFIESALGKVDRVSAFFISFTSGSNFKIIRAYALDGEVVGISYTYSDKFRDRFGGTSKLFKTVNAKLKEAYGDPERTQDEKIVWNDAVVRVRLYLHISEDRDVELSIFEYALEDAIVEAAREKRDFDF